MKSQAITKEQWIAVFRDIQMDDATMQRWHQAFEARYPEGHQAFLEWLGLTADEIAKVRAG